MMVLHPVLIRKLLFNGFVPLAGGMALLFLVACADKTDTTIINSQTIEASAAFRINWHTELDPMGRFISAAALDCAAEGIVTVRCEVYDGDGVWVASGGPWRCTDQAGRVTGIPPGIDRRFIILGEDESGITWQGQSAPVDLQPGDGNDVGTIDTFAFRPLPKEPSNGARVAPGPVSLTWASVTNAAAYHVMVATDAGFDNQAIIADTITTAPDFTLAGYVPGSGCYWKVYARDAFGNESTAVAPLHLFHTAMEMPDLVDMAQIEAQYTIEGLQLVSGPMNTACSDTIQNGSVIDHQPAYGSTVYHGDAVAFTVSDGLCNVNFPDGALEASIREAITIPAGAIPEATLSQITVLSASNLAIGSIEGLQYLTNLQSLDLRFNQIGNIDALSGLINLRSLYLVDNQIQNIDALSGLTNLRSLNLVRNQIQSIDALSGLTAIETLFLSDNQIGDIDALSGLTGLSTLDISNNQIQDIDALSGLTQLSRLDLSLNRIQSIEPIVNNQGIGQGDTIDLSNNPLDAVSCDEDIPMLINSGAVVSHSCLEIGF